MIEQRSSRAAATRSRPWSACTAGSPAPPWPARTASDALRIEVQEIHDGHPDDEHTRELAREYRAVVEEILELRGDDGRIAAFLRSVEEPGALADTSGLSPDISNEDKLRLLETIDVTARLELAVELQRERLAELQVRSQDPRRRRVRRPETAARLLPAQTDGVDPQGAGRGRDRA